MLIEETNSHDLRIAMLPFVSALKVVNMYIATIEEELFTYKRQNPIEHVKSRLKRPSSIARKLEKKGIEPTLENAVKYVDDIAGVRIVCQFQDDIYKIAEVIQNFDNVRVVRIKDYIKHPKENGYRSYHMHVEIPVRMLNNEQMVKVEFQLRTVAMDFWASLEHKIRYKNESEIPENISRELKLCATLVEKMDAEMQTLNNEIEQLE
ncbi:MAG: GTP pyrophosphokinase family protein [Clostridia bacterium]|nr:GTP pyrophosphokinase family protein [Clostridia bacterium]